MDDVRTSNVSADHTTDGSRASVPTGLTAEDRLWMKQNREAILAWNVWDEENELFTDQFSPLHDPLE